MYWLCVGDVLVMFRWYMDDVWIMFGSCLEDAWILFGWWLGDVSVMSRWCLDNVWIMFGGRLDDVWVMFWWCLGDVWIMFGGRLDDIWVMFWWCLGDVLYYSSPLQGGVLQFLMKHFGPPAHPPPLSAILCFSPQLWSFFELLLIEPPAAMSCSPLQQELIWASTSAASLRHIPQLSFRQGHI